MDNLKNKAQSCARIQKIEIRKLFNMFDYDIEIDNSKDVSVLIAPNGCGKTTIFNFISFILNPTGAAFAKICTVPFERFALTFSDGKTVIMQRKAREHIKGNPLANQVWAQKGRERLFGGNVDIVVYEGLSNTLLYSTENIQGDRFRRLALDEGSPLNDLKSWFARSFEERERGLISDKYVNLGLLQAGCRFITANRLQDIKVTQPLEEAPYSYAHMPPHAHTINPIDRVKDKINESVSKATKAYIARTDEARDKLLQRYLDDNIPKYSDEEFYEEWKNYNNLLERYKDIGFVESTIVDGADGAFIEKLYENKKAFLKVYLKEFSDAISVFDEIYPKLSLFAMILNKRNETTKKIINFKGGELNITCNGEKIPLECLSSGEKNDIIMFYELIFNCKQGDIVLIDEPEISLHISWQEEYIDRLLEICKMNSLQAIIATHSPNIINDHTDLIARSNMYYV